MKRILPILILLAACAVFLSPLARPGFFISDDGEWMIIRLSAFYQSLAEGQFPVRFLGRLNNSYGYPVANFLYPGFLYIGSFLHLAGASFVTSVKLILAGSVIGASLGIYFLLKHYKYSVPAALAGVAAFLFSPYVGFDLYRRGSVGEILAFFAGVLTIYAVVARKKSLLPVAVAFLIVAHNSLALLVLAVCGAYMLAKRNWSMLGGMALGVGISAFFWLPALYEQQFVPFAGASIADSQAYFPISMQLIALGLPWTISVLILIFGSKKQDERFWLYTLLALIFFASSASGFFWRYPASNLIQFPYRMLGVAALAAPMVVAGAIRTAGNRSAVLLVVFALLWAASAVQTLSSVDPIARPEGFYTTNEGTTTVADEYMPVWVREPPLVRTAGRVEMVSGDAEIVIEEATTQRFQAAITAQTEAVLQINTIYYPGWGVVVDGTPADIDYTNPRGLMQVSVPSGTHTLVAEFRETVPRFAADIISFLSVAIYGLTLFLRRRL